jgi:hypothetical protein
LDSRGGKFVTSKPLELAPLADIDSVLIQHAPVGGGLVRQTDWHVQHVEVTW